ARHHFGHLGVQHRGGGDFPAGILRQAAFAHGIRAKSANGCFKCAAVCSQSTSKDSRISNKPLQVCNLTNFPFWNPACSERVGHSMSLSGRTQPMRVTEYSGGKNSL